MQTERLTECRVRTQQAVAKLGVRRHPEDEITEECAGLSCLSVARAIERSVGACSNESVN